jgi:hypothetical protein
VKSNATARLSLYILSAKAGIALSSWPLAAFAEDALKAAARTGSVQAISALTWLFILGFSMLGWTVSELDKVAELWHPSDQAAYEKWRERLKLLKGVAASNLAGILVFFMSAGAPDLFLRVVGVQSDKPVELPEMVQFVFVSAAGYMGARFFAFLERKFFPGGGA